MPLIRSKTDKPAANVAASDPGAGLGSVSPDERWAAARAAITPASVTALAQALAKERETRVREAIFTALARIATSESALAVLPYVRSDDVALRTGALDALRAMPETAEPHLPQLLADADADVRLLACDLVRNMRGPNAADMLYALLESEQQSNVCAAAVEVIAEIGDAAALPSLARCAARFPADPFLAFAIKVAADRLRGELPEFRG